MRRISFGALVIVLLVTSLVIYQSSDVQGAAGFADPAFQTQWSAGEAITPNFWGPTSTAKDGQQEPYQEASGGSRLVQYFDKGRMELTNGTVTNGLLASEIVKGQVQIGNATFQAKPSPAIPIAGDPDNPGPTYAVLGTTAANLLTPTTSQVGTTKAATVAADGTIKPADSTIDGDAAIAAFDDATKHNVPGVFVTYRNKAGLSTIGFAISEPFGAVVKVAGQQTGVLVQVFERRVLTFTPTNAPAFQVEMGNIGQHYFQWRYTGAPVASASASASASGSPSTGSSSSPPAAFTGPVPNPPAPLTSGTLPPGIRGPISPPSLSNYPKPPYTGPIYKCSDFPSQAVAQAYLRLYPFDPSGLDPGKTGIACPSNPAPTDMTPVAR